MKRLISSRVDERIIDAIAAYAKSENRSFSNALETALAAHFGVVLDKPETSVETQEKAR